MNENPFHVMVQKSNLLHPLGRRECGARGPCRPGHTHAHPLQRTHSLPLYEESPQGCSQRKHWCRGQQAFCSGPKSKPSLTGPHCLSQLGCHSTKAAPDIKQWVGCVPTTYLQKQAWGAAASPRPVCQLLSYPQRLSNFLTSTPSLPQFSQMQVSQSYV